MSLRIELNNWIKSQGYVSYDEVEEYCKREHYKIDTARRRLEPGDSPSVEAVKGIKERDGGEYVKGWKWKQPTWESLKIQIEKNRQEAFKLN